MFAYRGIDADYSISRKWDASAIKFGHNCGTAHKNLHISVKLAWKNNGWGVKCLKKSKWHQRGKMVMEGVLKDLDLQIRKEIFLNAWKTKFSVSNPRETRGKNNTQALSSMNYYL